MISPTLREALQPLISTQRLLWGAIVAAVFPYVLVVFLIGPETSIDAPALGPLFPLVAAVLAALSWFHHQRTHSDEHVRRILQKETPLEQLAQWNRLPPDEKALASVRALSGMDRAVFQVARSQYSSMIIELALNDAIALVGLVHALLSGRAEIILPYAIVSVLLSLRAYPRMESIAERMQGRQFAG